jgi:hypothetical protein
MTPPPTKDQSGSSLAQLRAELRAIRETLERIEKSLQGLRRDWHDAGSGR